MRINRYIARSLNISRRKADEIVDKSRVTVNDIPATHGQTVLADDTVKVDGKAVKTAVNDKTILLHKPSGYVCSREGQGSATVYDLLPKTYHALNPVGRLDKDSSGLLLLTTDGTLAHELTHPRFNKQKVYIVRLNRSLTPKDERAITDGVELDDGTSSLQLQQIQADKKRWQVTMSEGRNRQIRRTFRAKGYTVASLHRIAFGPYTLKNLQPGKFTEVAKNTRTV